jgi:putative transposase
MIRENDTGTQLVCKLAVRRYDAWMARKPRVAPGGVVYHVLNRSAGRVKILDRQKEFVAFENLIVEARDRHPLRILSYCLMGTHWHFVVLPEADGDLTAFFRWLAHTHAMRWRVSHRSVGDGHLYQGRFKSFPVQQDAHLLTVCRYVERNALSAGLVDRAEHWRWSSLWAREQGPAELRAILSPWPVQRPTDWIRHVNERITAKELERLRGSVDRGQPFGTDKWTARMVARMRLEHTVRGEGRPKKSKKR